MNRIMENHLKGLGQEGDDSFYIDANDHKSIALNTTSHEANIKMRSPFVSKTERYPAIKPSPGPGQYNLVKELNTEVQNEMKVSPQAFGSTYKNRTHFLNVEKTPFGKPTFLETPGVGYYHNTKKIPKRIQNEIMKAQKEREVEEGIQPKPGFMSSGPRPCLAELPMQEVGPGKYSVIHEQVNHEESSSKMPKLKGKDSMSVFISTSPRFKDMAEPPGLQTAKAEGAHKKLIKTELVKSEASKLSQIKQLRKENFEKQLQREKSKQSSVFQSKAPRFVTPRPLRLDDLSKVELQEIANHAALFGPHQKNLVLQEMPNKDLSNSVAPYTTIKKNIGFNSLVPRFKSSVHTGKQSPTPGPGSYGEGTLRTEDDLIAALYEADGMNVKSPNSQLSAMFRSEPRLKNSCVESAIKEKSYLTGPGAYNTNKSTVQKKTFNYELAHKA